MNIFKTGLPAGRRGFTIIEMIVYMGLVSVFLVILSGILISVLEVQLGSNAASSVDQGGQYLLVRLQYDIRRAEAIVSPVSIGQTTSGLSLTIGGTTYAYTVNSGILRLTYSGKTYDLSPFDVEVSEFNTTRIGNPSGKNSLLLNYTLTSRSVSTTQKSQVRNYQTTVDLR